MAKKTQRKPSAETKAQPHDPRPDDPRRTATWQWAALAGICLAAVLLRAAYLNEIVRTPDFEHPAVDARFHDYWAWAVASGDFSTPLGVSDPKISESPYFRPPGYPYFLAGIYAAFGHSYLAARVANMLLGLAGCLLAFAIGRRFYRPAVGLIFAGGMAVYWAFIYFEGELHAPALLIALLLAAVYLLGVWAEKFRLAPAASASALLGLGALVRPNVGLLVPVVAVWAGCIAWRRGGRRKALLAVAALIAPAILLVLPTTIRNKVVGDDLVVISSNTGINLYIGNNPNANGGVAQEIAGLGRFETCFDYPAIVANLEAKLGRPLKHSEVSAWFSGEAWQYIGENPGRTAELLAEKFRLFWGAAEVGHNKEIHYEREFSGVLKRLPGDFATVTALAAMGFAMMLADALRRRSPGAGPGGRGDVSLLIGLWVLVLSGSILPFFVAGRYRVPVIPLLLLAGAYGVVALGDRVTARRFPAVGLWAGVAVLAYVCVVALSVDKKPSLANWHYGRGLCYVRANQPGKAEEHFHKALAADPRHARSRYNLGVLLAGRDDMEAAADQWDKALKLDPRLPEAHSNFGMARLRAGRVDDAILHFRKALAIKPDFAMAHSNLAQALMHKGKVDKAVGHWQEALRRQPRLHEAYDGLGKAMYMKGKPAEAEAHYRQALSLKPNYAEAHNDFGRLLLSQGKLDPAAEHFAAAIEARPEWARPRYELAGILLARQKPAEAMRHLDEVVKVKPDWAEPHYQLGLLLLAQAKPADAARHFAAAVTIKPDWAEARFQLGQTYQVTGKAARAREQYREALKLQADHAGVLNNMAWMLATHPDAGLRDGAEAVRLATRACEKSGRKSFTHLDTLAAAHAEAGQFDEAVKTAEESLRLARQAGDDKQVRKATDRLKLYRNRKPYRDSK